MTKLRFTTRASIAMIFALLTIFSTANLGTLKAQTNGGATRNENLNQNKPPNVSIPGPYRTHNSTMSADGTTAAFLQRSQKKSVDQRLDRLEKLIEKLLAQNAARSGGNFGGLGSSLTTPSYRPANTPPGTITGIRTDGFRDFIPNRANQPTRTSSGNGVRPNRRSVTGLGDDSPGLGSGPNGIDVQNPKRSSSNRSLRSTISLKKARMNRLQNEVNRLSKEIKALEKQWDSDNRGDRKGK